jgi:hypothetical protein
MVRNLPRDQQLAIDSSGRGLDIADEGFDFPNSDPQTIEFAMGVEAGYRPSATMRAAETTAYPNRAAAWGALDLSLARGASPLAAYAITNTTSITSRRNTAWTSDASASPDAPAAGNCVATDATPPRSAETGRSTLTYDQRQRPHFTQHPRTTSTR